MSSKAKCISVSAKAYARMKAYCDANKMSMRRFVELSSEMVLDAFEKQVVANQHQLTLGDIMSDERDVIAYDDTDTAFKRWANQQVGKSSVDGGN